MSEPTAHHARVRPCASCPYRRDVPSGIWDAEEYQKLPAYDGDTAYQHPGWFACHSAPEAVCAGWLAHTGDPWQLLAVRLGVTWGQLDESVTLYSTDVPLFRSGAAAAAHGLAEIDTPSETAVAAADKILAARAAREHSPKES